MIHATQHIACKINASKPKTEAKTAEAWCRSSEWYDSKERNIKSYPQGFVNMSPGWYAQGHEVSNMALNAL